MICPSASLSLPMGYSSKPALPPESLVASTEADSLAVSVAAAAVAAPPLPPLALESFLDPQPARPRVPTRARAATAETSLTERMGFLFS